MWLCLICGKDNHSRYRECRHCTEKDEEILHLLEVYTGAKDAPREDVDLSGPAMQKLLAPLTDEFGFIEGGWGPKRAGSHDEELRMDARREDTAFGTDPDSV